MKNQWRNVGSLLFKLHFPLLPPNELLPVWYQEMWDEIEKSIFMQRETILN